MSKLLDRCMDMSRDLTMTPKRLNYAEEQEQKIFDLYRYFEVKILAEN